MIRIGSGAAAAGRLSGGYLFDKLSLFAAVASLGGGAALIITQSDSKLLSLIGIVLISMAYPMIASACFKFMPRHPGASFSLVITFSYFGYVATKMFPEFQDSAKGLISLSCGIALFAILLSDVVLAAKADKNKKHLESIQTSATEERNV